MGIVAARQRKRRSAQLRKGMLRAAGIACALAVFALWPLLQEKIRSADVETFSRQPAQLDMKLKAYDVYALQLAVFDSGERAANELARLQGLGYAAPSGRRSACALWPTSPFRGKG